MAGIWNFTPFGSGNGGGGGGGGGGGENPQDDGEDSCPFVEVTNARCDPPGSGLLKLTVMLPKPSGCELFPPLTGALYALTDFGNTEGKEWLHQFPAANGSIIQYALDPGFYLIELSGKYDSLYSIPTYIGNEGFNVTGFSFTGVKAANCKTATPVTVRWSGSERYSLIEDATINGTSHSGFSANLKPGDYTVEFVRGDCQSYRNFTVEEVNPIRFHLGSTGFSCLGGGNNGSAEIFVSGGSPPYSYFWSKIPSSGVFSNAKKITNLTSGFYQVSVIDSIGCQPSGPGYVNISANKSGLNVYTSFTSDVTNEICCQNSNTTFASLYAVVQGGALPYSYLWSNGSTSPHATGLSAGNHSVTVTDANGCVAISSVQEIKNVNNCVNVKWLFGDGGTQTYIALPSQVYNTVSHTYGATGVYTVKLLTANGLGDQGISCHEIIVPACPEPDGDGDDGDGDDGDDGDGDDGDGDDGDDGDGDGPDPDGDDSGDDSDTDSDDGGDSDGGTMVTCCGPMGYYGRTCYGGVTAAECSNGGGRVFNWRGFSTAIPADCANDPTMQTTPCGRFCEQRIVHCCTNTGCQVVPACSCEQQGGTMYDSAEACNNGCYCTCCQANGQCDNSGRYASGLCVSNGGQCVSDCSTCSTKSCCELSGNCPGEDGCECGDGCCCCPEDQACGWDAATSTNGCVSRPC